MNQNQGAALGIETMRKFLAQRFAQYGSQGSFSGIEIARIIMAAKVPEIPKQREEPEAKTA